MVLSYVTNLLVIYKFCVVAGIERPHAAQMILYRPHAVVIFHGFDEDTLR